jgi:hypothetical protein
MMWGILLERVGIVAAVLACDDNQHGGLLDRERETATNYRA